MRPVKSCWKTSLLPPHSISSLISRLHPWSVISTPVLPLLNKNCCCSLVVNCLGSACRANAAAARLFCALTFSRRWLNWSRVTRSFMKIMALAAIRVLKRSAMMMSWLISSKLNMPIKHRYSCRLKSWLVYTATQVMNHQN